MNPIIPIFSACVLNVVRRPLSFIPSHLDLEAKMVMNLLFQTFEVNHVFKGGRIRRVIRENP